MGNKENGSAKYRIRYLINKTSQGAGNRPFFCLEILKNKADYRIITVPMTR